MAVITFIGGGSYAWMPSLLARTVRNPGFAGDTLVLMDPDAAALGEVAALGRALIADAGADLALVATTDRARALDGADHVVVTIAVGGLEAMAVDLAVPERFGIHQTVGDTVGPGGLSRALRNIPVLVDLAREMERRCPRAWLLNLSNPLTALTRAVTRETSIRAAGLCQGAVEHVAFLAGLLGEPAGMPPNASVDFVTAGIDHCPFLLELRVRGRDGLAELAARGHRSPDAATPGGGWDRIVGVATGARAGFALWDILGALPGIGDRHFVENLAGLVDDPAHLARYGVARTSIDDRRRGRAAARAACLRLTGSPGELDGTACHAPVAEVIAALAGRGAITTTLNVENVGQIADLPPRANVETLCRVDATGVHPLAVGRPLPRPALAILHGHIQRQEGVIDAALAGDEALAAALLATDPQLRRPEDARPMLAEMIDRNRVWLPRFRSAGAATTRQGSA
ncbi:MAG TPA: hypothetical protein VEL07_15980 [Planctomycetota bacterium]|nr:hypothetical protein [Planctomycetota bacterium]